MAISPVVRLSQVGVLAVAGVVAYLGLWPVDLEPVAWNAPPAPPLAGPYAPDQRLRAVEWLGRGVATGPEATAIDDAGRVYAGTSDGRVLRLDPSRGTFEQVATTVGRPLGMAFDTAGRLYLADTGKGLLRLHPDGRLEVLSTGYRGAPFGLIDDLDVGPDGTVYFTDASWKYGLGRTREDILEHGGHGRLLAWRPGTGETELLLGGLQFANGVAVAGDGSYVLVNETGAYRVTRYWLAGPRRGQGEPFAENLPGLPDNITWSRERKAFWVALFSPRVRALDDLSGRPFLRKVVYRLPLWIQPQPARHAWALAIDEQGKVVESLQASGSEAYAPVTSVRERDGVLWLGSLERDALGRMPAPPVR